MNVPPVILSSNTVWMQKLWSLFVLSQM